MFIFMCIAVVNTRFNRSGPNISISRTLKTMAVERVPAHYGFVDISTIESQRLQGSGAEREKSRTRYKIEREVLLQSK